jgi:hypothetical protein
VRYYDIEMSTADGTPIYFASLQGLKLTSLLPGSVYQNAAALNVEMDIPNVITNITTQGIVRVWGLGLADIGAAFNLNPIDPAKPKNITISAGMSLGFPLATPSQAGVLVKGSILQAFGNWLGTEQTVDIIFGPPTGTQAEPKNFTLNWPMGQPLSTAIQNCIQQAYQGAAAANSAFTGVTVQISPRLVQNYSETGVYGTLAELQTFVNARSRAIVTDTGYRGVSIAVNNGTVVVFDNSAQGNTTQILFQDLIGQPTWIKLNTITVKLVMRGDLQVGQTITLPPSLVTNTAGSFSYLTNQSANNTTFSGNFQIRNIHHYGNFRQPDAASWNTTVEAISLAMLPAS